MVTLTYIGLKKAERNNLIINTDEHDELENLITEEATSRERRKPGHEGKLDSFVGKFNPTISPPNPEVMFSPRFQAAAIKLQKFYKGYRTRRNLADCAVVIEELWWKALDSAALERSSVSFFDSDKSETAVSRWARARTRAAKVGKGLSKDDKAQKLSLRHWLEAIDPRHRYGHNLHLYYDVWFNSASSQPFFYWLDVGDGKEESLEKCPRTVLQRQCITYLGPKERKAYEVVVDDGKLVYRQSRNLVSTREGSKWIFVLSASRNMYVGEKIKGLFQHSSFVAGGATIASGRVVACNGVLEAVWCYSGHYRPTEESFYEFISFLEENNMDLTNVKKCPIDDDVPSSKSDKQKAKSLSATSTTEETNVLEGAIDTNSPNDHQEDNVDVEEAPKFDSGRPLPCNWATGAGPRIGCVRDYPTQLQSQALEQVNLSPRVTSETSSSNAPIPSPRPSPNIHLSPRLAYMGLPSPRLRKLTAHH